MKIKSMIVAAAAAVLVACGGSVENNPEAVTKAFVKAMSSKDFSEAAGYCTETSAKVVTEFEKMADMMPATSLDKEDVKCEVNGDKATCKFCCAAGKGEETYNLVKENGNWKVDYVKGGLQNTEMPAETIEETEDMPADDSTMTEEETTAPVE